MLKVLTSRHALVLIAAAVFLAFQALVVGLLPAHVVMVALLLACYFAHPVTRRLVVALFPFVLFEISYDWMRLYPNYLVNEIDIRGLYDAELSLFGVAAADGTLLLPGQWLAAHGCAAADFMAGVFYLCWVPVPVAFALWLFFSGREAWCLRFSLAFLLVNWIGFVGYYVHPAAPPWYAVEFGFTPDFSTPGNVAGLGRFDALVGVPLFESIYVNNANIFAAVPSLHAAYMLVATVYAVMSRQRWWLVALFAFITLGIWLTAVYTLHHYVIDVLLGIATALAGILLFEKFLLRCATIQRLLASIGREDTKRQPS